MGGTETLTASLTGKAAAANLNSNSNAPLSFPEGTLAGPVSATIIPMVLGGGNSCTGHTTWLTSQGPLAVTHTSQPAYCAKNNAPPPMTWTENTKTRTCHFDAVFSKGTFAELGGKFAATTWHGTYLVTASGNAKLDKGKKTCGFSTVGNIENTGAGIAFSASGPMTG